jgi:hypothetical protein
MRPLAERGRKQLGQMTQLPSVPAENANVRPVFFAIAFKSMIFGHFDQRAVGCKGVAATRQFGGDQDFLLCFVHIDQKDRREVFHGRSLLRQMTVTRFLVRRCQPNA